MHVTDAHAAAAAYCYVIANIDSESSMIVAGRRAYATTLRGYASKSR